MKPVYDYKKAYTKLFTQLMRTAKDAAEDGNELAESYFKTIISEHVPPPVKQDAQIIAYLVDGLYPRQIGKKMNRSPRTIESRLLDLRKAYGAISTYQIIGIFFRNGWIK